MSNLTLVNDALSLIGVLPSGMDANPEDGATALRTVNEMVDEWADDGVTVNWSQTADLNGECPLVGNELTAVKYHLAIRLCPHFARNPDPTLIALAQSAYTKLARKQMVQGLAEIRVSLPVSEGVRQYWNAETDS